jgi:hypothetical protein
MREPGMGYGALRQQEVSGDVAWLRPEVEGGHERERYPGPFGGSDGRPSRQASARSL